MDYHNPFYKQDRYNDESLSDDNTLSGEQIIFPPISGPGPGPRPPQTGPGPGPRPPQPGPGPGPGPRPPQPGPGPGPRPPQPGPGPGPRPPQPGPGPGPGPRPPQPGPGPGPRPPQPGPGPRPPQPGPPLPGPVFPPPQPMAPPPNFIPELPANANAQGPEAFRLGGQVGGSNLWICLNRYTYMWLFNGSNFWFFPTFIGRNHVEGFRWRRNSWVYERINLRLIFFFLCF